MILEVVRGRFPFDTLNRKVMEVKMRYGSSTLLIEDSPISRGLIQSLREQSINVTVYKRGAALNPDHRSHVTLDIAKLLHARLVAAAFSARAPFYACSTV